MKLAVLVLTFAWLGLAPWAQAESQKGWQKDHSEAAPKSGTDKDESTDPKNVERAAKRNEGQDSSRATAKRTGKTSSAWGAHKTDQQKQEQGAGQ